MRMTINRRLCVVALAGSQLVGIASVLKAQEIEEITVTAQRRATNLQNVPISITAFSKSDIELIKFSDSRSLSAEVPNLQISSPWGPANPNIYMRGIGNGDVNAVAGEKIGIYQDQVYTGLLIGQNFQLFDLERIEVLKGPQGTLYGKNTTGGAINIISRKPSVDSTDGYMSVDVGKYSALSFEGAKSFVISDKLSARFAGVVNKRDGTSLNLVNGRRQNNIDNYALRGMVRYQNEDFDALLRIQRGRNRSDFRQGKPDTTSGPNGASITGFTNPSTDPLKITTDENNFLNVDQDGVALILNWKLGGVTLTSITSYDEASLRGLQDADHSADSLIRIGWRTNSSQAAQELRVTSDTTDRFNYIVGLFYSHERIGKGTGSDFHIFGDLQPNPPSNALDIKQDMDQTSNQYAVFGDANYKLTDTVTLNGGLRYTIDKKAFNTVAELISAGNVPLSGVFTVPLTSFDKRWTKLTSHIGLEYKPNRDLLFYGGFSTGYNSGGFNGGAIVDPGEATAFGPETLNAWEVGTKTSWFNRRATLNMSAFYYDYKNLQVQTITTSPFSNNFIQIIENASNAVIYGGEIELSALVTDHLKVNTGVGLLHTEYKNFKSLVGDASGHRLPQAPSVDFNAAAHYQRPLPGERGDWFMRGEISFATIQYYDSAQTHVNSSGGSNAIVNLKLGWVGPNDKTRLTLWVKNVTNHISVDRGLDLSGGFGFVSQWYSDPRTYGVQLSYKFD